PGGLDRGRHLIAPRGARTRPTASKVRRALLNILGPPAGPVLDLYAGTGALGMEALSRGAPQAVFVERDGSALSALLRHLREMKMEERGVRVPPPPHPPRDEDGRPGRGDRDGRARGAAAAGLPDRPVRPVLVGVP